MDSNKNNDYFKIINATFISYIFHGLLFVFVVFISLFQKTANEWVAVVSVATIVYFLFVLVDFCFSLHFRSKLIGKLCKMLISRQAHIYTLRHKCIHIHTFIHPPQTAHTHSYNDEGSSKPTASHHHIHITLLTRLLVI